MQGTVASAARSGNQETNDWNRGSDMKKAGLIVALVALALGPGDSEAPYNVWFDGDWSKPRVDDPKGAYRVLLPGEPGYETADLEVESGWVRLWEPPV